MFYSGRSFRDCILNDIRSIPHKRKQSIQFQSWLILNLQLLMVTTKRSDYLMDLNFFKCFKFSRSAPLLRLFVSRLFAEKKCWQGLEVHNLKSGFQHEYHKLNSFKLRLFGQPDYHSTILRISNQSNDSADFSNLSKQREFHQGGFDNL